MRVKIEDVDTAWQSARIRHFLGTYIQVFCNRNCIQYFILEEQRSTSSRA